MGAYNYSTRSIHSSRSIWLPTLIILVLLLSFLHLSSNSQIPENSPVAEVAESKPVPVQEDDGFVSELAKDPLRIYVPPASIPKAPLGDIFQTPPDDKPKVSISDLEANHQTPPASSPATECAPFDLTQCPDSFFDLSQCPSLPASASDPSTPPPTTNSFSDRPLITYAYAESDFARVNLAFFVAHGLHDAADFIFILNGETDVAETILPEGRPNIKIIKRENTCFDLGAHAEVLSAEVYGVGALKNKYKRFILMNASIRGPFVPHWSGECWTDAYLGKLNEKVKLVGSSLNCMGGTNPHVQSMIWATDSAGLAAILEPEGIGECFESMDAAMGGEIRTTGHVRSKGYEVDVMLSVFQTEKDYKFVECNNPDDFLFEGSYYGFNVHPFETLFVKSHRGIADEMLEKLSQWTDMSGYSSYDVCKAGIWKGMVAGG